MNRFCILHRKSIWTLKAQSQTVNTFLGSINLQCSSSQSIYRILLAGYWQQFHCKDGTLQTLNIQRQLKALFWKSNDESWLLHFSAFPIDLHSCSYGWLIYILMVGWTEYSSGSLQVSLCQIIIHMR